LVDDIEKKDSFISDAAGSYLELVTTISNPTVEILFKKIKGVQKDPEQINLEEFISVKGWKAQGNQLTAASVKEINLLTSDEENDAEETADEVASQNDAINDDDEDIAGKQQITLDFE
jgi:topoisomerase-4 subunit A